MKKFTLKISFCNVHAHIISITTVEANKLEEAKAKCFKKFSNRTINKIELLEIK
ncbi:hypothetical protein AAW30_01607 [Arcobacter porcinus]|uniref:hypothetical protein n=1 Tax=Arcobacter porcinus TaxID=1935204 RepID=UPI000827AC8E|nr:hypothetical protein [Arcobacter porcinus]OCL82320.1 hypothetical protein AAW30_01607 [Arcobacter porcinus]